MSICWQSELFYFRMHETKKDKNHRLCRTDRQALNYRRCSITISTGLLNLGTGLFLDDKRTKSKKKIVFRYKRENRAICTAMPMQN